MSLIVSSLKKIFPFFAPMRLFFDLGTDTTRIAIESKGIVYREATLTGYNRRKSEYMLFGNLAKDIMGKSPDFIEINRPIVEGVLQDFDAGLAYLKYAGNKAVAPYVSRYPILRPNYIAYVCVPSIAKEIEIKALRDMFLKSGCSEVFLIERALATAAGCGLDIFSTSTNLVVDVGAGLMEASIVSGGGLIVSRTIRAGGNQMDKFLQKYILLKNNLITGEPNCEIIKINLLNFEKSKQIQIKGKSQETGLPKSVKINSQEVIEAAQPVLANLVNLTQEVCMSAPAKVTDEVFRNGIKLTGGVAKAPGLGEYLSQKLKMRVYQEDRSDSSTINGLIELGKKPKQLAQLSLI